MSYNNDDNDYLLLLHSLFLPFSPPLFFLPFSPPLFFLPFSPSLFFLPFSPSLFHSTSGWSVYAYARISLINQSDPDNTHSRGTLHTGTHVCFINNVCVCVSIEISHWFSAKENDWGYVSFFPWKVILIIIIIIIILMS